MTGNQIRERIIANNELIARLSNEGQFVLSPEAHNALEENKHLQQICDHLFDDLGYCVYCDWREV